MTAPTAAPEDHAAADGDGVAPMQRRMLPLLAAALAGCAATGPVGAMTPLSQQPVRVRIPQGHSDEWQAMSNPIRAINPIVSAYLWSPEVPGGPEGRYVIARARANSYPLPPGRVLPVDLGERLNARAREASVEVVATAASSRRRFNVVNREIPYVTGTERYERELQTLRIDPAFQIETRINFEISDIGSRLPVALGPGEHLLAVIESIAIARTNNQGFFFQSFPDVVFVRGTVPQIEAGLLDRTDLLARQTLEPLHVAWPL